MKTGGVSSQQPAAAAKRVIYNTIKHSSKSTLSSVKYQ